MAVDETKNWVTITYVIDEGPRYKVRNVSVIGNTKYTSDELMADLKLKDGEYFNQAKMAADQGMLQDRYGGVGYVFADVKADPRFLEEPAQLDLVYNIKEGDRYRVGKINIIIKGEYPHTQLTTVLNRLSLKPGDIVDIREIRASQRRLRASQIFEANPANGNAPKIVYNPPGQEEPDEEELAQKPKSNSGRSGRGMGRGMGRGPDSSVPGATGDSSGSSDGTTFRGQSPDPQPRDRVLDITVGDGETPSDCGRGVVTVITLDGSAGRGVTVTSRRESAGGENTLLPPATAVAGRFAGCYPVAAVAGRSSETGLGSARARPALAGGPRVGRRRRPVETVARAAVPSAIPGPRRQSATRPAAAEELGPRRPRPLACVSA